jgi:tetratricopeptide (TPR) repeat protein
MKYLSFTCKAVSVCSMTVMACIAMQDQSVLSGRSIGDLTLREVILLENEGRRSTLLEQFVTDNPRDEASDYVLPFLRESFQKQKRYDKLVELTDRQLALHPADFDLAYDTLKTVEETKTQALSHKAAQMTAAAARAAIQAGPKPEDASRASQVMGYADYVLYTEALQIEDLDKRLELLRPLSEHGAQSPYYGVVQRQRFDCYRKLGNTKLMTSVAEETLKEDPDNEEMLITVMEGLNAKHNDPARVGAYAQRLLKALRDRPKPDSLGEADWNRRKAQLRARTYMLMGNAYFDMERFSDADQALRQALPLNRGDDQVTASVLVKLGWANYQMKNFKEALRFNQECLNLRSSYRDQAAKNIEAIQFEAKGK